MNKRWDEYGDPDTMLPWFLDPKNDWGLNPDVYSLLDYIVLDFETTNLDKGSALNEDNHIVMASWWDSRDRKMRSVYANEYNQQELERAIAETSFVVAHNAKFELQWMRRMGIPLEGVLVYCTQIGEVVKHGNVLAKKGLRAQSLDYICRGRGIGGKESWVAKAMKWGICPSMMPRTWLIKYCERDVRLCHALFGLQRSELIQEGKLAVQFTRCITTPVLADIEFNGMCLDKEAVEAEYIDYTQRLEIADRKLAAITGGINMNSPKQVSEYIYGELGFAPVKDYRGNEIKTKTGNLSTKDEVLDQLKPTGSAEQKKVQRRFLKLRKQRNQVASLLSKNLTFFKGVCDYHDGVFYGQLHQTNVQTHRLASTGRSIVFPGEKKGKGCQLQNLPRIFKKLFQARREGWSIGEADGSQLEFRVGCFLGQDVQGANDIANSVDIHSVAAEAVNVVRQAAKEYTFRPMYGGQSGDAKQRKWNGVFATRYYGLHSTQKGWVDTVLDDKVLRMPWGMEFFWPDTKRTHSGYITNTTNIFNYPIQSLATADMIPITLVHFWHRAKRMELRLFLVNTVHDSIIAEIPPEENEVFVDLSRQTFGEDLYRYLEAVYGLEFNVPLGMGVKVSSHWTKGSNQLWELENYENPKPDDPGEEFKEDFPAPYKLPEAA